MKLSVLGLGNWGTALANHLALCGHDVLGWSIESAIVEGINNEHRNPLYQSDILLEPGITATADLKQALKRTFLVLVVPSSALSDVVPQLHLQKDSVLVSAIKGLEMESNETPLGYAQKHLPQEAKLAVLSGPSFAKDIVAKRPAGVVSASLDEQTARFVAETFSSESLKAYISTDPLGVELGGILKNVIALAVGVCDGVGFGDSARAGLITRGLAEMMRLAEAMGAQRQTLAGLSGLGDLVMTATCDTSRNRTVGLRLGQGESLDHIIETLGSVAEGVKTTPRVLKLAQKYEVEMPISQAVGALLTKQMDPMDLASSLLSRPLKREFD